MLRAANSEEDEMYARVVDFALEQGGPLSVSRIQRRFHIGFNWAARFLVRMEQEGIIRPMGRASGVRTSQASGFARFVSALQRWLFRRP